MATDKLSSSVQLREAKFSRLGTLRPSNKLTVMLPLLDDICKTR